MTSCKARFLDNNFAENNISLATYSSQEASFPFTNAVSRFRKKVWIPSGNFLIGNSNTFYVNNGSDQLVTLTKGNYTGASLASHVQTQIIAAAGAGWTVSYDTNTKKFTINHSNTSYYVLNATNNDSLIPNDIWYGAIDPLGVMGFLNSSTINRYVPAIGIAVKHSEEYFILDMGTNLPVKNICLIGPVDEIFGISQSACIVIQANNINKFEVLSDTNGSICLTSNSASSRFEGSNVSPILIKDNGIFINLENYSDDTSYRFWKISIIDRYNIDTTFKLAHCYLGDYTEFTNRNLNIGFTWEIKDNTESFESEDGTMYFDVKPIQESLSGIQFNFLDKDNRQLIMDLFKRLGKSTPFYFQLDPSEKITDLNEFTKFCYFENTPTFNHIVHSYFNCNMSIKEII